MNDLPRVLQNEIWEYVRGDRRYWKQKHQELVTDQMNILIDVAEHKVFLRDSDLHMPCSKTEMLLRVRRLYDECWWSKQIPEFMVHQHRHAGQLFADTKEEFQRKCREFDDWQTSF
jgi:hypothetical protein